MPKDLPLFSQRLKEARKRAGLTQAEVCERTAISLSTYRRYEQGVTQPGTADFFTILEAINPPVEANATLKRLIDEGKNPIRLDTYYDDDRITLIVPDGRNEAALLTTLICTFDELNKDGKKTAVDRVKELVEIPRYRKNSTEVKEDASQE